MTFISLTKLAESLNDGADARHSSAIQRGPAGTPRMPCLFLSWVIAGATLVIRQVPGMAAFSPMILSMMIGIAFHNIVGTAVWAKAGVTLHLRRLLRIATNTVTVTHDGEVVCAIACVTAFGSVAMFAVDAKAWVVAAATFLAIVSAAIGLETDIGKQTARGFRPALLGALAFPFIAGFNLTLVKLME